MANPSTTQPPERTRIDVRSEAECRYWCREFGVRPKALKAAVRQVGDRPEDVRRQLQHLMNVRVDTTG
jgi:hypothetical protein